MFLAQGTPEYGWKKKVQALNAQDYMNFRNRVGPETREKLPVSSAALEDDKDHRYYLGELLMDDAELEAWNSAGVEVQVRRVKGVASNDPNPTKAIYQVSVANIGLFQVQRVDVLENCCTDELQRWLDRGWRIIAVCPPNDTRRPAYVMGHFEKEAS